MENKYLLSTGKITTKFEEYVLDLFRLYLGIYPNDIPGAGSIGFDFNLRGVYKANLANEVENRVSNLISNIKDRFKSGADIRLTSCELIDEKLAKIVVSCGTTSEEIKFNLYEQ